MHHQMRSSCQPGVTLPHIFRQPSYNRQGTASALHLHIAARGRLDGLQRAGFGIAGAETVHAPRDLPYAFDMAREAGLGITAHAGEWAGPESVRAALADLRPARIGHGVRAIEDPRLVEELAERGTVLEVCPGSNIALGLYPRWRDHPIGHFHDRGLRVTVSTDDPPFFRTSMRREYDRLADAFGWDEGVFTTLARTAAEAAFCDDATRARILKRLDKPHD